MLRPGDPLPDVTLLDLERKPIALRSLVEDGPVLLFFYLFDWSGT